MRTKLIHFLKDCVVQTSFVELNLIYKEEDSEFISYIEKKKLIENRRDIIFKNNEKYKLELSVSQLNRIGIYLSVLNFKEKNTLLDYKKDIFIIDEYCFLNKTKIGCYFEVFFNLSYALLLISSFNKKEMNVSKIGIVNDGKFLEIDLDINYDSLTSKEKNEYDVESFNYFIDEIINERKRYKDRFILYINELESFLKVIEVENRLLFLIQNFNAYIEKASLAYNIYLSDFSYNKLKIEIDSKALEFTQKLQTVINDAQNKLITIPSAFVLVLLNMDYNNPDSSKNWIITTSTFIFTFFIQIFVQNQKSSLKFIINNITSYKETFSESLEVISVKFKELDKEQKNQQKRIDLLQFLTWLVPILVVSIFMFINDIKTPWLLLVFYICLYGIIHVVSFYSNDDKVK